MALNFPSAPVVGQVYQRWTWNGAQWMPTQTVAVPMLPIAGGNITGNLGVAGTTTLTGTLTALGHSQINTLDVAGAADFAGDVTATGDITCNHLTTTGTSLDIAGGAHIKGNVYLATGLGDEVFVGNDDTAAPATGGNLHVFGDAEIEKDLKVDGDANLVGDVKVEGDLTAEGEIHSTGAIFVGAREVLTEIDPGDPEPSVEGLELMRFLPNANQIFEATEINWSGPDGYSMYSDTFDPDFRGYVKWGSGTLRVLYIPIPAQIAGRIQAAAGFIGVRFPGSGVTESPDVDRYLTDGTQDVFTVDPEYGLKLTYNAANPATPNWVAWGGLALELDETADISGTGHQGYGRLALFTYQFGTNYTSVPTDFPKNMCILMSAGGTIIGALNFMGTQIYPWRKIGNYDEGGPRLADSGVSRYAGNHPCAKYKFNPATQTIEMEGVISVNAWPGIERWIVTGLPTQVRPIAMIKSGMFMGAEIGPIPESMRLFKYTVWPRNHPNGGAITIDAVTPQAAMNYWFDLKGIRWTL